MSHSASVTAKTTASVERAREEVNTFKAHVNQLLLSDSASDQALAKSLAQHISRAESLVTKAESTVKRMRQVGRVPRPTASSPPALRAKRALSVLRAGLDPEQGPADSGTDPSKKTPENAADKPARNVKQKTGTGGAVSGGSPSGNPVFLSAAGKPIATALREADFKAALLRIAREADLLGHIVPGGVGFECRNVFRAFIWFKETDPPGEKPPLGETPKHAYIVPEHIGCFGVDETNASRWGCSRYAVFKVITERANAAIRYFMAREKTGEEAFLALAKWLARHKTLFTAKCEDRRLAFDASRGIFLPCCIYPFEGNGPPRFTRGSIPVRSNSAYATQPTVRLPQSSHAQNGQAQNVQMSVANGAQAPPGISAAPGRSGTNTAPPARREGATVAKQQPVPVATGGSRGTPADARGGQNRSRN